MPRPDVLWTFGDGAVLDMRQAWLVAARLTVAAYKVPWSDVLTPLLIGGIEARAAVVAAYVGNAPVTAVRHRLLREFTTQVELAGTAGALGPPRVEAVPGAASALSDARTCGHVAVVTSLPRALVHAVCRRHGLMCHVEVVIAPDRTVRAMPEPDLFRKACAHFDIHARYAIAVESDPIGVQAARAAGMLTVRVGEIDAMTPTPTADLTVPTVAQINFPVVSRSRATSPVRRAP